MTDYKCMVSAYVPSPEEMAEQKRLKKERQEAFGKIICPFCSVPWTEEMIELFTETEGYESTGMYEEAHVKITCKSCNKLIYEK